MQYIPRPRWQQAINALFIALLCLSTTPCPAQELVLPDNPLEEPDRWLSEDRWSEVRYGLSIREPIDPLRIADTQQGDVIRWALPKGTRIRLSFARGVYEGFDARGNYTQMPAKIDILKKQISDELKASVTGQVINTRADQVIEVGEHAGIINYYIIKPDKRVGEPYLYGVALLQLDELSVAILRLECPPDQIVPAVCTFECMLNTITTEPAKDANRRLNGWLINGETLLKKITQQDRVNAMQSDRLYRVLEAGKDIGYVRVWQRFQDKGFYEQLAIKNRAAGGTGELQGVYRMQQTGNALIVQSHYAGNRASMDRLYEAVDTPGKASGVWQFKSTLRYENDPQNRRAGTWVETGVRGTATIGGDKIDHLQITREGTPPRRMVDFLLARERDPARKLRYPSADPRSYPSGDLIEKAWPIPKRAFLSMVDAALVPALLPREKKNYAFTAYDPETARVDIRTMRVEPNNDGGKTVYIRPVLDKSEEALIFDANNELVRHRFPDGREMRRTTRQELAQIWGRRLRD